ncbi:MAG: hypothetical protein ACYDAY_04340 [Candidatus Dormibacteria bacterium]
MRMNLGNRGLRLVAVSAAIVAIPASSGRASQPVVLPAIPQAALIQGADAMNPEEAIMRLHSSPSLSAVARRSALTNNAVPGANGTWTPLGAKPLNGSYPGYDQGIGDVYMSGRIQSFTYDPATGRVWAAVGSGGVWETDDTGQNWHSVSDNLPTQAVGAVGWSSAQGGTLIAGTGDSGFEATGEGVFRSLDGGRTWLHANGMPEGALSYVVAVSPDNPSVSYVATTKGLWVSTDDAQNYQNVGLPTGCTDVMAVRCFFANWVTDVVVQPKTGKVLTAVGWYQGPKMTANGWPEAPGNGLYASDTGAPGTFKMIDTSAAPSVFTPQTHIGVVRLGMAYGPNQNHDIVYASVQDVGKLNGALPYVDATPPTAIPWNSYLDGIYESTDFGQTWIKRTDWSMLETPASQSALVGYASTPVVSGYSPGIQSWYNNWIVVDPTTDSSGAPTRVLMGLEEIWESSTDASLPGPLQFHVIGRYWSGSACLGGLNLPSAVPYCPSTQSPTGQTTTHPDQHGFLMMPDGKGGVTLFAGNDGGAYAQHVDAGSDFSNGNWGNGANIGLHTLLPYMAVMAKDGTAYAGLQDNGEDKVLPNGDQAQIFGGDGFFSATDPNNSNTVYEEYVGGTMNVSVDGGKSWTGIGPPLTSAQFSTPFAMDPLNADHLVIGGRNIMETTSGPKSTVGGQVCVQDPTGQVGNQCNADPTGGTLASPQPTDWQQVFDLGVESYPGSASGVAATDNPNLTTSAVAIQGANVYVGWCVANCVVPRTQAYPFRSGIATNVGGAAAPASLKSDGWHIASAVGLPQRVINWIQVDPGDANTIYVALGDEGVDSRHTDIEGANVALLGHSHLYKSTDAGETFTSISGNLPDTPADSVTVRGSQLLVGTDVGAFISSDLNGTAWSVMGAGQLPVISVRSLEVDPGDPNTVLAATYGRGMYLYHFTGTAAVNGAGVLGTNAATSPGRAILPNTANVPGPLPFLPLLPLTLLGPAALTALLSRRRRAVS